MLRGGAGAEPEDDGGGGRQAARRDEARRRPPGAAGLPDDTALVGVGGYVATPMYLAARRAGVPAVVHEANAKPGLANRLGARWAARVATALPQTRLPGARWVGMPMRPEISGLDRHAARPEARRALGLDAERTTVVVTGGSSGLGAATAGGVAHAGAPAAGPGRAAEHREGGFAHSSP